MFKHEPHPDYQPAFWFYSKFPTSILVSISWYSPGVFPRMETYTIRTRYSLRHRFKYWLSIQKEYSINLVQITLKIDGMFFWIERYIADTHWFKGKWKRKNSRTFSLSRKKKKKKKNDWSQVTLRPLFLF